MAATQAEEASVTSHQLNDDVVAEILLRLPSTSVLRFRAVSRAWRAITTRPDFLAAHARRRPLELVVAERGLTGALYAVPLDDLDDSRIRCLLPRDRHPGGHLIASCDGLLLLELRGPPVNNIERLVVCNPVTRQWTAVPLPESDTLTRSCGFYLHRPSGEHRLLFLTNDDDRGGMGTSASHYVRSLETGETRPLGPAAGTVHMCSFTPRPLHLRGNIHWVDHPEAAAAEEILVFDTAQETFRRMPRPPVGSGYDASNLFLLETAEGMLTVAAMCWGSVDLWVMEDYNNGQSWTRRHRVDLPPPLRRVGWVMTVGQNVLLPGCSTDHGAALYDPTEKRVLKQLQLRRTDYLTGHVFRESLQRHAFFDLQQEKS